MIMFVAAAGFASSAALAGHNGSPIHTMKQPPVQTLKQKK
jgi:hypothetical protein